MILLLGSTGYIGQAFQKELETRSWNYLAPVRNEVDYTSFHALGTFLRENRPDFLVNAAGFTGKPNVDACELARAQTLHGNTLFPAMLAHLCADLRIPWGHVSSGCIYAGAKVAGPLGTTVESDLSSPAMRDVAAKSPSRILGFTELDTPNFSFRHPPCSFYSGTKALAEEAIQGVGQNYIWRLRIPFDHWDNPRNYLTKIQTYQKVYDNVNSISHRADFVRACLDLWEIRAPFGTYNVTNPGFVTTREVVGEIQRVLQPARGFEFWADDAEFYRTAAKTPRSNCVLDPSKLLRAGVKLRPVTEALQDALRNWTPQS